MILDSYLTEAEEVIMHEIWEMDHEPVMSEVFEAVRTHTGKTWQSPTVSTYLKRLVQKGYLQMNHVGRDYLYEIRIDREAYMRSYLERFVERFGDSAKDAIAEAAKKQEE